MLPESDCQDSESGQLTLLLGDFLASLSVAPGSDEARQMTVTSGLRCSELLRKSDPVGCLARMLLASSAWHSTACYLTWRESATPRRRLLFQLVPSVRPTDEIESGWLPTPNTPRPHDNDETAGRFYESQHQKDLTRTIAMLPTPTQRDYRSEKCSDEVYDKNSRPLSESLGKNTGMRLQPGFALWMMGFPEDWCDLEDGE